MNVMSALSEPHWTDEELIHHLYGLGPADGHFVKCEACQSRLAAMQNRRENLSLGQEVSDAFLAAQRRKIYARLSEPERWWQVASLRRWVAAAAMVLVFAGSAVVYENRSRQRRELERSTSDAQLAQEVSQMSVESESQATAPLRGLFEE